MKKSILLSAALLGVVAFNYQFSRISSIQSDEIMIEKVDQLVVDSDLSIVYPTPVVIHYPLVVPPIQIEETK